MKLVLNPHQHFIVRVKLPSIGLLTHEFLNTAGFLSITKLENYFVMVTRKIDFDAELARNRVIGNEGKQSYQVDHNWRVFKCHEAGDFNKPGFYAKMSKILADANISFVPVSTLCENFFLIKMDKTHEAIHAFKNSGISVEDQVTDETIIA